MVATPRHHQNRRYNGLDIDQPTHPPTFLLAYSTYPIPSLPLFVATGKELEQVRLVASSLALAWALADRTRKKAERQMKEAGVMVSTTLEKVSPDNTSTTSGPLKS